MQPFVTGDEHRACGICPGRSRPVGAFDVAERPSKDFPFDPADGHRYTADRVPVCVHPEKIGIPPGRYRTDGIPLSYDVDMPESIDDLAPYLREAVRSAAPETLELLITQAMEQIPLRWPGADATTALRRALN
ncbi:hypothetical protein QR77_21265 [Streptomyces sp. 150FB]|uniref:hypothetical protein n=1 Tax=Streptomyces sp. 150FB TaxID=1576605 RepID=UPI0005896451|nr:hypothetical protein [Streptomyces sp. 150FB]KIF75732.1 hypothetical protein QR77_21265 [Streptomyces sp. 150FB]